MKYKIVSSDTTNNLAYYVNLHAAEGWRPQGNVFTEVREGIYGGEWCRETYYAQAMIKE